MIRFFDMFAGIGGFRSGLTMSGGFSCIGFCEIDKYVQKAYRTLYDTEGEYFCEDARKIVPGELPGFELLCAGFPCQAFSVAGRRLGFDDTRGTLFFEIARVLEARRPPFFLLENVAGLLSHDEGRTYKTILSVLVEMGYCVEWCLHNSKHFGVPQQRRRVYIVGYRDARCVGKIFPLATGDAENLKQIIGGSQGQRVYDLDGVSSCQTSGAGGQGGKTGLYFIDLNPNPKITDEARCLTTRQDHGVGSHKGENSGILVEYDPPRAVLTPDRETVRQQGRRIKEPDEEMFTITAQDRHGVFHQGRVRRLMPIESFRLQGYTDEQYYILEAIRIPENQLYKMAGNSVSVPVIFAIGQRIKAVADELGLFKSEDLK